MRSRASQDSLALPETVPANQMTRVWPGNVVRVKITIFWDAMSIFTPIAPVGFAAAAIR